MSGWGEKKVVIVFEKTSFTLEWVLGIGVDEVLGVIVKDANIKQLFREDN